VELELQTPKEEFQYRFLRLGTPQDIAELLEISYDQLVYQLYKVPDDEKYTEFQIAKKTGGFRKISAPATSLKIIQQKLNQVLQNVYDVKASVHSFIPEKSIVTNAQVHVGQKYVFNIDLKDFFPSINFGRVRGMFLTPPYDLPEDVGTVLAQICCFNNQLPQGAPTSPIISNMICVKMDKHL
jgi:RNA-directed DNA polymerase